VNVSNQIRQIERLERRYQRENQKGAEAGQFK
jgi:hypothetical protein